MFKWIRKFIAIDFKHYCQECNGLMNEEFYDPIIHKTVYKCRDCGKEWV